MSAEQAGLQWPLQASTGTRIGTGRIDTTISPLSSSASARAGEKATPVSLALAPAAGSSEERATVGDASSGSMSLSPLMIKSIRHGTDATTLSPLPPASGARAVRTPTRLLTPGAGAQTAQTGKSTSAETAGDKTAFFTPSSTPCPPRAVIPFTRPHTAAGKAGSVRDDPAERGTPLDLDLDAILANLNLSGPSLDLVQAHTSHSTALEQQVDLFRTLAARLAEEVEERDRALAGVKVRLVQSELRAVEAEGHLKGKVDQQETVLVAHRQHVRADDGRDEQYEQLQTAVLDKEEERRRASDDLEAERADGRVREHAARQREEDLRAELRVVREQLQHVERDSAEMLSRQQRSDFAADETAQKQVQEQDDRIRDLEIRLRMSQEDIERERRERQRGMDRSEDIEARALSLEAEKRDLEGQLAEWKGQVEEWKDRCEACEVELADTRDRLDAAADDVHEWKVKVGNAEEVVQESSKAEKEVRRELEREG